MQMTEQLFRRGLLVLAFALPLLQSGWCQQQIPELIVRDLAYDAGTRLISFQLENTAAQEIMAFQYTIKAVNAGGRLLTNKTGIDLLPLVALVRDLKKKTNYDNVSFRTGDRYPVRFTVPPEWGDISSASVAVVADMAVFADCTAVGPADDVGAVFSLREQQSRIQLEVADAVAAMPKDHTFRKSLETYVVRHKPPAYMPPGRATEELESKGKLARQALLEYDRYGEASVPGFIEVNRGQALALKAASKRKEK